jgi:hypothetical protein
MCHATEQTLARTEIQEWVAGEGVARAYQLGALDLVALGTDLRVSGVATDRGECKADEHPHRPWAKF